MLAGKKLRRSGRTDGRSLQRAHVGLDAQARGPVLESPDLHARRVLHDLLERCNADALARRVDLAQCLDVVSARGRDLCLGPPTLFLVTFLVADVAGGEKIMAGCASPRRLAYCCLCFPWCSRSSVSVSFDFGRCPDPSKASPYLTSGRLITGALVPFVIMYLRGLDVLLGWLRVRRARVPVVVAGDDYSGIRNRPFNSGVRQPIQLVPPSLRPPGREKYQGVVESPPQLAGLWLASKTFRRSSS